MFLVIPGRAQRVRAKRGPKVNSGANPECTTTNVDIVSRPRHTGLAGIMDSGLPRYARAPE